MTLQWGRGWVAPEMAPAEYPEIRTLGSHFASGPPASGSRGPPDAAAGVRYSPKHANYQGPSAAASTPRGLRATGPLAHSWAPHGILALSDDNGHPLGVHVDAPHRLDAAAGSPVSRPGVNEQHLVFLHVEDVEEPRAERGSLALRKFTPKDGELQVISVAAHGHEDLA